MVCCRYGPKNALNVAVGKNPDGSWAIGVANPTGIPTHRPDASFPNATELTLELVLLDELVNKTRVTGLASPVFVAHRSTANQVYNTREAEPVLMSGGKLQVTVGPNELLTLRSAPAAAARAAAE